MSRRLPLFFILGVILLVAAPRPAAPVNPPGSPLASDATTGLEQPTGAPHVPGGVDPGNGSHVGGSPEPSFASLPGPPAPPTAETIAPAMARNPHPPTGDGIAGQATWWDTFGPGLYAAIRPDLGHKGELAVVCGGEPFHCLTLPIITTCACLGPGSGRLIDLSLDAFASFAPPSRGVVHITLQVIP